MTVKRQPTGKTSDGLSTIVGLAAVVFSALYFGRVLARLVVRRRPRQLGVRPAGLGPRAVGGPDQHDRPAIA
jgi:hypothetical protein